MRDKGREGGVEHRPPRLPAQNHRFLAVIQALFWNPSVIGEGVLVPTNQREKITSWREVDEVASGKAQNIGKALDFLEAFPCESNLVWAPVHHALLSGGSLKADDRLDLGCPDTVEVFAQNGDSALVSFGFQFLEQPLSGDLWILLEKFFNPWFESIEFARPRLYPRKNLMTSLAIMRVIPQNSANGVSGNSKCPAQSMNRKAISMTQYHLLFEFQLVVKNERHQHSSKRFSRTRACSRLTMSCPDAMTARRTETSASASRRNPLAVPFKTA